MGCKKADYTVDFSSFSVGCLCIVRLMSRIQRNEIEISDEEMLKFCLDFQKTTVKDLFNNWEYCFIP